MRCLEALASQASRQEVEIIAVGRWRVEPEQETIKSRFPQVRWISVPANYTIPFMRSSGIVQSKGEIVAMLEDDCIVSEDWCQGVIEAHHDDSSVAIGGPVEPDSYKKALDWAVYFCEYGRFMRPFTGTVTALSGNNVTYKRAALADVREGSGFYEVMFHWQWQQNGEALTAYDGLEIHNVNSWSPGNVTTLPYHHGRAFAGMRINGQPWYRRWIFAGMSLALPLLQITRQVRVIASRRRYAREYIRALPWTLLFNISWSLGEFRGYLLGPGQSASYWR